MNNDERIELIKEIESDWFLGVIDGKTAMNRVLIVVNIQEPNKEELAWAKEILSEHLKANKERE